MQGVASQDQSDAEPPHGLAKGARVWRLVWQLVWRSQVVQFDRPVQ
ncbi:MAG: hypothetical protein WCD18_23405 [Thermosynechococcaceae cyanobacterium]